MAQRWQPVAVREEPAHPQDPGRAVSGSMWSRPVFAALLVALVLGAHAVPGRWPTWSDDEVAILLQAGQLCGQQGDLTLSGYPYDLGWTLALIPAWFLGDAPFGVYYWALGTTVAAGAALVWPLRRIAMSVGAGPATATWVAAVIAILPARTVYSSYALLENFLTLIVAWVAVAGIRYARRPGTGSALLLAAAISAAALTHQRMVGLVAATCAWLTWSLLRRTPGAGAGLVTMALGSLGAVAANRAMADALYHDGGRNRQGRILEIVGEFDVGAAITILTGQLWYHAVAAFGLTVIGAVAGLRIVARQARERPVVLGPAAWWLTATLASMLVATTWVIGILSDENRFDLYMYGRYAAPTVLPVTVVGLATVVRLGASRVSRVSAVSLLALAAVVVANQLITRPAMAGRPSGQIMNFPGLLAWGWPSYRTAPAPPGWAPSLLAVAVLCSLWWVLGQYGAARWDERQATRRVLAALAALAVLLGAVGQARGVVPFSAGWRKGCTLNDVAARVGATEVTYETTDENAIGYKMTALCLAPAGLPRANAAQDPIEGFLVARPDWPGARELGAIKIADDGFLREALYVLPGEQMSRLQAEGELPGR
ncbi:MAG: hypothetical protein CSA58_00045 [Micrococcales bacterium]|nr:MAG: hypothetical protein CSB46_07875 [Micrococcales bacterium]PIE28240.1 MAG: hypothetical protein CSA58_00045 [Micrococcales bacterium]